MKQSRDALGEARGVGVVDQAGQDDRELVAAEPADRVPGADGGAQPRGHLTEQLVARGVAEGVVDLLEPVEVAEQDAEARAAVASGSASSSRSRNSVRFGRPVSASWVAWCRTVASSRAFCSAVAAWSPTPRSRASTSPLQRLRSPRRPRQPAVATPRNVLPASSGTATTSAEPIAAQQPVQRRTAVRRAEDPRLAVGEHADQLGGVLGAQAASSMSSCRVVGQPDRGLAGSRPVGGVPQQDAGAGAAHDARQRLGDDLGRPRAASVASASSCASESSARPGRPRARASSRAISRSRAAAAWPA